jgi:hypothetical protein
MTDLSALSDDELRALHAGNSPPADLSKVSDADLISMHNASKPSATAPAGAKQSGLADFAESVPTGVAKAVIGAPGIPGTFQDMGNQLVDRIMLGAGHKIMDWTGYGPQAGTPERDRFDSVYKAVGNDAHLPTSADIVSAAERDGVQFHHPTTPAGGVGEAIGENAAGALFPGGPIARAANVVVPAVASEAAGQASAGSKFEPLMRFLGGLAGNLTTGVAQAARGAPERMVRHAVDGVTPAEFDAAANLQGRGEGMGVRLSGPEAIQATTDNATRLSDIQRIVENSAGGGSRTARFYSERPGQVDAAVNRTLDTIAPQSPQPDTLGPRAAEVAGNALDTVRQNINTATRPAYQAAENHMLEPADFDPIARSPAFQVSLQRLRDHPVLGPEFAHLPDNSVGVIDAVTKDMNAQGTALNNSANAGFNPLASSRYTVGGHEARDIARDPARGGIQEYDDALTAQEQARRQNLEPLEQGPLGRLAAAKDTPTAGEAVLPSDPRVAGHDAIAAAIQHTEGRTPGIMAPLVRQRLADQYDTSAGRLVGGPNQYGGARFAKDMAGSAQAETNLHAALGALPTGAAAQPAMQDLLDVLRATGTRRPQGSATAFNQQLNHELQLPPLATEAVMAAKSGLLTIPGGVRDRAKMAWLGRGTGRLANMFLEPDSVEQIRGIANRAQQTPMSDAMLRQLLETPVETNRGR